MNKKEPLTTYLSFSGISLHAKAQEYYNNTQKQDQNHVEFMNAELAD